MGWWVSVIVAGAGVLGLVAAAVVPRAPAARLRYELSRLRAGYRSGLQTLRSMNSVRRARRTTRSAAPNP